MSVHSAAFLEAMSQPLPPVRLQPEHLSAAAAIVANMIESFLDAEKSRTSDAPPVPQATLAKNEQEMSHDSRQDHPTTPATESVRLRTPVDAGPERELGQSGIIGRI